MLGSAARSAPASRYATLLNREASGTAGLTCAATPSRSCTRDPTAAAAPTRIQAARPGNCVATNSSGVIHRLYPAAGGGLLQLPAPEQVPVGGKGDGTRP